jgi:hypothetical protein
LRDLPGRLVRRARESNRHPKLRRLADGFGSTPSVAGDRGDRGDEAPATEGEVVINTLGN